jgi:pimeloyl-ACP methyl ester carboxylesterase
LPGSSPELDQQFQSAWTELQQDLLRLSSNSSQIVATGSGHYVQVDRPDLVINAIHTLVAEARQQ